MKIAHIGFGKTATSTLQMSVFPAVTARLSEELVLGDDSRIRDHVARMMLGKRVHHWASLPHDYLVSSEDLHGWDPHFWEIWADKNLEFFGRDCHILLTLREPKAYLTAVYLQTCLHQGNVQAAEDFFLSGELYSPLLASEKFAVEEFSYARIIDIYRKRFRRVTVVKYESIKDMRFLREFFEIDDKDLAQYCELFGGKRINKSYSERSVRLTMSLQRLLGKVGYSLRPSSYDCALLALSILRDGNRGLLVAGAMDFTSGKGRGLLGKVLQNLRWRSLMQRMDIYFQARRYTLDFTELPHIDLASLSAEYDALSDICTFDAGAPIDLQIE